MISGCFDFNNAQFNFNTEDDQICFDVSHNDYCFWKDKMLSQKFLFEDVLHGTDDNGNQINIQPRLIKSVPSYVGVNGKGRVALTVDYIIVWTDQDLNDHTIDGISASLASTCESFSYIYHHQSWETSLNRWVYDGHRQRFIWKSNNFVEINVIFDNIYLLINSLRFLCQLNIIGQMGFDLLCGDMVIGKIQYCKNIDISCKGKIPTALCEVLQIISQPQFESILCKMNKKELFMAHVDYSVFPRPITPGWFINVVAGFEWECRRFEFAIKHSEKSIAEQKLVINFLDEKIQSSSKHGKNHYSAYKDAIVQYDEFMSLGEKIKRIFEDTKFKMYWNILIPYVYKFWVDECKIHQISGRINRQRNNFAHGNLDQEFDQVSIIDILMLRRVLYILQLDKCNIEEYTIMNCYDAVFPDGRPF